MTADEKSRMLLLVRAVESLFSENCALKTALAANGVSERVWKPQVERLLADPEISQKLHAKFQHLYDDIEQTRDESGALEALLEALPKPKKEWN